MSEELLLVLEMATEKMEKAVNHLELELSRIRAGKANTHLLDGITVDYYGTVTPLSQVANISTPDPKTIAIQPWEKSMIGPIEKAIMASNLGITPVNNGELIRINIPPLTEERRKNLVKLIRQEGETAKVSIRNSRREANEEIKQLQKDGIPEDEAKKAEEDVQKLTTDYSGKTEKIIEGKEIEIMTV